MMHKIFYVLILVIFTLVGITADAGQVGMAPIQKIPQHGHSGATDGGTLNAPTLRVYRLSSQTLTCGAGAIIAFNGISIDNKGWFNTSTYRYTPQQPGKYLITLVVNTTATTATYSLIDIQKNGAITMHVSGAAWSSTYVGLTLSDIISMNGTTDYIDANAQINGASACQLIGTTNTVLNIMRISN